MKIPHILMLFSGLALGVCNARTWTSADGKKTFEADFRSFNPTTGEVSVVMNGKLVKFKKEVLSADDIKFVSEAKKEASGSAAEMAKAKLEAQKVGSVVVNSRLHRLDGKRFKKAEITKVPEYYLLYFSASW